MDYTNLKLVPISDLKVGDVLTTKGEGPTKWPHNGDKIRVYDFIGQELTDKHAAEGIMEGGAILRVDFTSLREMEDGEVVEHALDSRYFTRIE